MTTGPTIREALRSELTRAMKSRDSVRVSACRSAMTLLDNASAVPLDESRHRAGAVEQSAVGVGAADGARRELTEDQLRRLVADEIVTLRAEADTLRALDGAAGSARADEVYAQAEVLAEVLAQTDDVTR